MSDLAVMFLKLIGGVFRLPFIAVSDYRYEHDPKYREKIKKLEAQADAKEETRIKELKEKLNTYVQKDLAKEMPLPEQLKPEPKTEPEAKPEAIITPPSEKEVSAVTESAGVKNIVQEQAPPSLTAPIEEKKAESEIKPVLVEKAFLEAQKKQNLSKEIDAVIIAKPMKGYSPLKVSFSGSRSYSRKGRIVAYSWDFGDTDTSTKANPVNTYYSSSLGPKKFNVTLTVKDNQGNTALATCVIEVLNK